MPKTGVWVVAAALVVGLAWVVAGLQPFTGTATAVVVGAGLAAVVGGILWWPRTAVSAPSRRGAAGWAVLLALLTAWELAAYVQSPRADHPTLSSIADAALDGRVARAAACALWLAGAAWIGSLRRR